MNQINSVDRNWFSGNKINAFIEDYDSIWEYDEYEFGVNVFSSRIQVDVFDSKRWFLNSNRRNHVGTFSFKKCRKGKTDTWQVEEAMLAKKHQGRGLAAIVYKMLATNGYPVQSGTSMSVGAAKLWSRLAEDRSVEILTYDKGHWNRLENFGPQDVYEENKLVLFNAL